MNEAHQACGGDEWRGMMRNVILPWAIGEVELGDDVSRSVPATARRPMCSASRSHTSRRSRSTSSSSPMLTERFADARQRRDRARRWHRPRLSRRSLLGRGLLHDAAPRAHERAAGPALRGGGPRAQARRRTRGERQPRRARTSRHTTKTTPTTRSIRRRSRRGCAPLGSLTSRCAPTRTGGRRSLGSRRPARRGSRPR